MIARVKTSRWGPPVGLGIITLAAALAFARIAWNVPGPDVFGDELYYMEGATSLADGDGLGIRGGPYHYPPGYPIVLAAVLAAVDDRSLAYQLALVLSAIVAATIAVPSFLVARRLATDWKALAAAAVVLILPVSFYAAYVMSDAIALVVAVWALLAIQLATERPTVTRQLAVVGAVGVATAFRAQYAVLLAVLPLALGVRAVIERRRPGVGASLRRLWPTLAVFAAGVLIVLARAAAAGSVASLVGSYAPLWRSYSPVAVLDWTGRQALAIGWLFLFVPAVLLPGIVASLVRSARRGDLAAGAFVGVWLSTTVLGVLLVAAFSATPFGLERLHDRYLTFALPLWVVAVAAWAVRGAPVLRRWSLCVAGAFATLALLTPVDRIISFKGTPVFDGFSIVPWAIVAELGGLDGWGVTVLVLVGLGLATAFALSSAAMRTVGLAFVVVVMTFSGYGMWTRATSFGGRDVFVHPRAADERLWVDRRVGGASVLALFVRSGTCKPENVRSAFHVTEFFNASVGRVVHLTVPLSDPTTEIHGRIVRGVLVDEHADPVRARLVIAPARLRLAGKRLASATTSHLVLWKVGGTVRVLGLPVLPRHCDRSDSSRSTS